MRLPGVITTAGSASAGTSITSENIVDWGGARELNRDNYYITEDSQPAKLGRRWDGCCSSTATTCATHS